MTPDLREKTPQNTAEEIYRLPRDAVRRSFHAASRTYDQAAALQQEVRSRLLERLDVVRLAPAGAGHARPRWMRDSGETPKFWKRA